MREDDHSDEDADTVWITLPAEPYPQEHPGEGRTSEFFAVFGKQCLVPTKQFVPDTRDHVQGDGLPPIQRYRGCLLGNGAVTAGVIWGIQAKPSEAYDNPAFGWEMSG